MTTPSKALAAAFAVSIALISIGAAPVLAADMNGNGHGSMKDRGNGGVPVPAPVPYEEHYKYYMGAGIGWAFRSSGDVGLSVGGTVVGTAPTFGGYDEFRGPGVASLYAGRYVTPSLRLEVGLDLRGSQSRERHSSYQSSLSTEVANAAPLTGTRTVTNTYDVSRSDEVRLRNNTLMFNAYYDLNRGGRLTPYIGAGIGISQVRFSRSASETIGNCVGSDPNDPLNTACQSGTPALPGGNYGTLSHDNSQTGWGVAASLMAGLTYNLSARTHLDVGYRLMYQGATASISAKSLGPCAGTCLAGVSTMDIGSRVDHEIRTGIRWDLW